MFIEQTLTIKKTGHKRPFVFKIEPNNIQSEIKPSTHEGDAYVFNLGSGCYRIHALGNKTKGSYYAVVNERGIQEVSLASINWELCCVEYNLS